MRARINLISCIYLSLTQTCKSLWRSFGDLQNHVSGFDKQGSGYQDFCLDVFLIKARIKRSFPLAQYLEWNHTYLNNANTTMPHLQMTTIVE